MKVAGKKVWTNVPTLTEVPPPTRPSGVDGPLVDLLDVIAALRRNGVTTIRIRPAGDDHRDRAERIDRLLYDCGFDVADLVEGRP